MPEDKENTDLKDILQKNGKTREKAALSEQDVSLKLGKQTEPAVDRAIRRSQNRYKQTQTGLDQFIAEHQSIKNHMEAHLKPFKGILGAMASFSNQFKAFNYYNSIERIPNQYEISNRLANTISCYSGQFAVLGNVSTIQRFINQFETSNQSKAFLKSIGAISNEIARCKGINVHLKTIVPHVNDLKPITQISKCNEHFYFIAKIQEFASTDHFVDLVQNLNQNADAFRNIFKSFPPETFQEQTFQQTFMELVAAAPGGDIPNIAAEIINKPFPKDNKLEKSLLVIQGKIQTWLAVFSVFLAIYFGVSGEANQKEIMRMLNSGREAVIEKTLQENKITREYIEKKLANLENTTHYVVTRAVRVRTRPTTKKSKILDTLYTNQLVELIERKGKWIKIRYYDYITDEHHEGWSYKKYYKPAKNPLKFLNKRP